MTGTDKARAEVAYETLIRMGITEAMGALGCQVTATNFMHGNTVLVTIQTTFDIEGCLKAYKQMTLSSPSNSSTTATDEDEKE